ncbi:MAG: hypothetical protein ACK5JD_00920 [Mangrovibacterium sp.]
METKLDKKLNAEIIQNLQSANSEVVSQSLSQIRENGNSAYIPSLVDLLHSTQNHEIKKQVTNLLAELKHSDAVPLIIDAIRNKKYSSELQFLVSACWENGLDYLEYLPLFVDLMIEQNFKVAFEAHTVITNMTGRISREQSETQTLKIKQALPGMDNDKRGLLEEIVEFLPELEAGIEPQEY